MIFDVGGGIKQANKNVMIAVLTYNLKKLLR